MQIQEHADLRHLNTFHVSASARYFAEVSSSEALCAVLSWAQQKQLPFMLIGQGSNILFRENYPGLIIELHIRGTEILKATEDYADIKVMGGEIWHELVEHTLKHKLYGLENLSLIPGTVGAAPVQNIGAYGVEVKDYLLELDALEISTLQMRTFSNQDCRFSYRSSVFKAALQGQFIICSVTFRLHRQPQLNTSYPALQKALAHYDKEALSPQLVSDTVCKIRRSKLPDHNLLGNAGSFFWNPHITTAQYSSLQEYWPDLPGYPDAQGVKVPAAWLIEQAGWKGYREGDVGVHRDHALVLVNHGSASGADLAGLSEKIQASVQQKFGIALQPEVRII